MIPPKVTSWGLLWGFLVDTYFGVAWWTGRRSAGRPPLAPVRGPEAWVEEALPLQQSELPAPGRSLCAAPDTQLAVYIAGVLLHRTHRQV